jgi:hypothetical protein
VEDLGDSNSPDLPEDHPNSYKTVVDALLPLYRKALMCPQLTDTMDFRLHGKGTEKHAKRIANAIKLVFGIEFNWKVVMYLEPTVERMVHRLQEARIVLAPSRLDLSDENESAGKSGSLPIVEVTESSENRPRRISHSGENRSARQRIRSMSGQEKAKQLEIIEKEQLRRYSSRSPPRTRLTDRKVSEVIAGHECGDN